MARRLIGELDTILAETDEAEAEFRRHRDAMEKLGDRAPEDLQKTAREARRNFEKIRTGRRTAMTLRGQFEEALRAPSDHEVARRMVSLIPVLRRLQKQL